MADESRKETADNLPDRLSLRGTIANRTYGLHKNRYILPIFTNNIWSYLQWSPVRVLIVGRTCLCYSYHKLLWLPGGCFSFFVAPRFICYFLSFSSYSLYTWWYCFSYVFRIVCHFVCDGTVSLGCLVLSDIPFSRWHDTCFVFRFDLFIFVSCEFSLLHRMCMSCLSYPVRWHCIALSTLLTA